jgi:F0F1-type ATP synthase assembly protein I
MPRETEQSKLALAFSVGTVFASSVIGGLGLGYFLDNRFGTSPWLLLTGIIIGTAGGFVYLYRLMSRLN